MKFSETRKIGWPQVMAKGKNHYILMYGILPSVIGAFFATTIYLFVINRLLAHDSYTTGHIVFVYIMNLIIYSIIGSTIANTFWKSNVKNFDK